jgi:predicted transcriptional regulator
MVCGGERMRAILMSIPSKRLVKILNGERTTDIRKSVPKKFEGWVYLYCSKYGDYLVDHKIFNEQFLNEIDVTRFTTFKRNYNYDFFGQVVNGKVVARFWYDSAIKIKINDYGYYAVYIRKLEIFDKPKELNEFKKSRCKSWQYVEVEE